MPRRWSPAAQLIFGIIAFACVASWADLSNRYGYMVWCGVSTIVLTLGIMMLYCAGRDLPGLPGLIIDGIWWIFW